MYTRGNPYAELICSLASAAYKTTDGQRVSFIPRVGDHMIVPQQQVDQDMLVNDIRPVHLERKTGTISFWDRKRECGRINGNIAFNISDCTTWSPRTNDEVIFYEIGNKKGPRAIDVKKLRGAAVGKKRAQTPNAQKSVGEQKFDLSRRFVFRGVRPDVAHRRETPPVFLPNFDVPAEVTNAIRNGDDILAMLPSLPEILTHKNYQSKMTALLYCEEVAEAIQIGQYTMKNVQFEYLHNSLYTVNIPGIKTDSPKLLEV